MLSGICRTTTPLPRPIRALCMYVYIYIYHCVYYYIKIPFCEYFYQYHTTKHTPIRYNTHGPNFILLRSQSRQLSEDDEQGRYKDIRDQRCLWCRRGQERILGSGCRKEKTLRVQGSDVQFRSQLFFQEQTQPQANILRVYGPP